MHVKQSHILLDADHQKVERITAKEKTESTSVFAGHLSSSQALLWEGQRLGTQVGPASILVMTDEGLVFREPDASEDNLCSCQTEQSLFHALYRALTGKELPQSAEIPFDLANISQEDFSAGRLQRSASTDFLSIPKTVEVNVSVYQKVESFESTTFQSSGVIHTADGQRIDLNLNLHMKHAYSAETLVSVTKEIQFKDPLVLNFDGLSTELSQAQFDFDLDADGELDLMRFLENDGGWLARDINGDGKINDGSELFGAISGRGFDDLFQFDDDGNQFIDEADAIYDELLIWKKTAEVDQLLGLKDVDVGAIYLGASETPFDIKNDNNEILGRVAQTGIYLSEQGEARVIQQVDVAV